MQKDKSEQYLLQCDRCDALSDVDQIYLLPGEILCKSCYVKKQVAQLFGRVFCSNRELTVEE